MLMNLMQTYYLPFMIAVCILSLSVISYWVCYALIVEASCLFGVLLSLFVVLLVSSVIILNRLERERAMPYYRDARGYFRDSASHRFVSRKNFV